MLQTVFQSDPVTMNPSWSIALDELTYWIKLCSHIILETLGTGMYIIFGLFGGLPAMNDRVTATQNCDAHI